MEGIDPNLPYCPWLHIAAENTAALHINPNHTAAILERIPAGCWGTPGDLKGMVVFLASGASNYMHGAIVLVDGGWLTR